MAGCLDSINWNRPEWLDFGEKRNAVASIVAGSLVSWLGFPVFMTHLQLDFCIDGNHLPLSFSFLCSSLPDGGLSSTSLLALQILIMHTMSVEYLGQFPSSCMSKVISL